MILPDWTAFSIAHHIFLVVLVLSVGPAVYYGQSVSNYNKPRSGGGIPARLAMVILYATPILALILSAKDHLPIADPAQWAVDAAVFIHFTKRVLESLFLHKYSRAADPLNTLMIAFFYSQAAFTIGWLNRNTAPAIDLQFVSGAILFLIGIAENFYHHKLLADQREDSLRYFIPQGALFKYVVCPHYLFEILTWLGIALLSRHAAVWLNLFVMISFLTGQSLRALSWYRATFDDFPKNRKAILPFVL